MSNSFSVKCQSRQNETIRPKKLCNLSNLAPFCHVFFVMKSLSVSNKGFSTSKVLEMTLGSVNFHRVRYAATYGTAGLEADATKDAVQSSFCSFLTTRNLMLLTMSVFGTKKSCLVLIMASHLTNLLDCKTSGDLLHVPKSAELLQLET